LNYTIDGIYECVSYPSATENLARKERQSMNTSTKLAVAVALLLGPAMAGAQSITFDFTGRVADATYATANPPLIPDGNLVTGSFTFTYDPLMSGNGSVFGTVGSTSPNGWLAENAGFGPGTFLFSSTVQVVGFSTSYSTSDSGVNSSLIRGGNTDPIFTNPCGGNSGLAQGSGGIGGCEMSGSGLVGNDSWIFLNPATLGTSVYSSDGLPDPSNIAGGSGEFVYYTNGATSDIFRNGASGVQYEITSVMLAPEISATSAVGALTLLIGGLLVLRGRRTAILPSRAAAS
jgi:hypothetical protein